MNNNNIQFQNTNPFFVVGSGRSGSTLLRLILASHSGIFISPETWFIIPLIEEIPLTSTLTATEVEKSIQIITSHYRWADMGIEEKELCSWAKNLREPQLRDILNLIYDYHLKIENKRRWGDKTPPYIRILPELALLYPEALFIHIVRDGHDVTKSMHNQCWHGKWLFRNAIEWKESIAHYNLCKKTKLADRILMIKYEDLVLATETTVKKICRFLGENFEPSMLRWENQVHKMIPQRELQIHQKLFRRPRKNDVSKWVMELSLIEILIIESYLNNELKSLGYNVKLKGMLWKPVFFLVRSYCDVLFMCSTLCKKVYGYLKYMFYRNRFRNKTLS